MSVKNHIRMNHVEKIEYLYVSLGDLVEAELFASGVKRMRTVIGRVVLIENRHALVNLDHAPMRLAPVLTVVTASGKEEFFCNSLVTEVFERGRGIYRPRNVFRQGIEINPRLITCLNTNEKGILCGPLCELAARFLAQISIPLERPIDEKKLRKLFLKHKRPGCVKICHGHIYYVKKKAFGKWVKRNALSILMTVSQLRAAETRIDQAMRHYELELQEQVDDDELMDNEPVDVSLHEEEDQWEDEEMHMFAQEG